MPPLEKLGHRDDFGRWLTANGIGGIGVEVGTYYAEFAQQIAQHWKGEVFTVDPYNWDKTPDYHDGCRVNWKAKGRPELNPEAVYMAAMARIAPEPNLKLLRMTSIEAAGMTADGSLAFAYVDGNHAPEAVRADLPAWWPKVRSGGIFAGHDFYDRDDDAMKGGVASAVWDFCLQHGLKPRVTHCTSWWIIKP